MGGALAVETGARDADVAAVIEDSGFGSLANVFQAGFERMTHLPAIPFGLPLVAIGELDLGMRLTASARWTTRPVCTSRCWPSFMQPRSQEQSHETLRCRLAAGEISEADFEQARRALLD